MKLDTSTKTVTVTMSYVRNNIGAMLHEIEHHGVEYILTKQGKVVAYLVPPDKTVLRNGEVVGSGAPGMEVRP